MQGEDNKSPRPSSSASFSQVARPRSTHDNFPSEVAAGGVWPSCWRDRSPTFCCATPSCSSARLRSGLRATSRAAGRRRVLPGSPARSPACAPAIASSRSTTPVASGKTLVDTIHGSLGKRLDLVYARNGVRTEIFVTPKPCPASGRGNGAASAFTPVPAFQRVGIGEAFRASGNEFVDIADQTARQHRAAGDALHEVRAANLRADRNGSSRRDGSRLGLGPVL